MHGVIAAGSSTTAEAGAEILGAGGHAVDAAVAACFATAVGEPTLTSLAGGGMMIVRRADSGEVRVLDFFSDAPRLGLADVEGAEFFAIDLDFGPTTQRFFIGAGSAAVPGVLPGLCEALERWGTKPLSEVIAPACRMMRDGVDLGPYQGRAARLLEPIMTCTESGRSVFARAGRMIASGDRFALPQLADTLEAMAARGWREHHQDVLHPAMVAQFGPTAGGLLSAADLDAYRVIEREPVAFRYRGSEVLTVPPPAAGGTMIGLMLELLDEVELGALDYLGLEHARILCAAMAVADAARSEGLAALEGQRFAHWQGRFHALCQGAPLSAAPATGGPGSTTHVSVIDAEGNAAAVTFSFGEGNGHILGGTGIMMNNLMGEEDLFPAGFGSATRGARLPTMMSPTLLIDGEGGVTVMGTGGANRIRTAIVQVVSLLSDRGADAEHAVSAPRLHFESGVLNVEAFELPRAGDELEPLGVERLVRFPERSLFFGGVHMVRRRADGTLDGAGDPRRGGACRIAGR